MLNQKLNFYSQLLSKRNKTDFLIFDLMLELNQLIKKGFKTF